MGNANCSGLCMTSQPAIGSGQANGQNLNGNNGNNTNEN